MVPFFEVKFDGNGLKCEYAGGLRTSQRSIIYRRKSNSEPLLNVL